MSALDEARLYRERAIEAAGGYDNVSLRESARVCASHLGVPLHELMDHLDRVATASKRNAQMSRGALGVNVAIESLLVGYALARIEEQDA